MMVKNVIRTMAHHQLPPRLSATRRKDTESSTLGQLNRGETDPTGGSVD
jgi:hypothetical protein